MATKKPQFKYMLVDGNALIHRGFHAIPSLATKAGEPTNAVYGFTIILLKAIKDIKPTHIACTFDLAGPTFRHEQYKDYKATRVKAAQELYDQIPRVKEVVRALNIPIFEKQGFEADDVLGTLATRIYNQHKENCEVIITTGDLDTLQLVNGSVKVYTLRKGLTDTVVYDARAVRERYGLNPDQMVDYRALRGDASDNIPGVAGIGEKTAIELIKNFGSLDKLYEKIHAEAKKLGAEFPISNFQFPNNFQIDNFKTRILNLLIQQEAQARQSYQLSQIMCDVPIETNVPPYDFDSEHLQQTVKLFQELEFRSLVAKLPKGRAESGEASGEKVNRQSADGQNEQEALAEENGAKRQMAGVGKQDYRLVENEEQLKKMLKEISGAKEVAVDTETTSLNAHECDLVGVGLAAEEGLAYYVPARLVKKSSELINLLKEKGAAKVGHNIKYDLLALKNCDIKLSPLSFDTMIASYLLNPGTRQHNLDTLAFNELGYQMQPIEELIGKGKKQITMDRVPAEKVARYCCEDVDMTLRLKELFAPQLREEGVEKIFKGIEMPLVEVLAEMEHTGIKLDVAYLHRLSGEAEVEIKELESDIHRLAGTEFNINSPKQLKEILFDKLGLVPVDNKKTKTGLSTAAGELEKMLGQHPIIPKLLEYRELTKIQSTYLLALPELVSKKTGRLHTSFNQTVAATGRLSSTDPNLQNIPVRGNGFGAKVRRAFVAEKGYKLLSLDYSQIELRIVAHLAKDRTMMEVFNRGEDIHTKTAMEIFGVPADGVTADMRRDAKTINFGILYGLSSFGLSSRIGEVGRAEARQFIERYFAAYPKVEEYIENIKLQVNQEGFVRNELGRIRKFPEIRSSQFFIRAAAERAAVNFPIQSLAADVIKVAMLDVYKEIADKAEEIKMLLQVHDELVFEVKEDAVEKWTEKLTPIMENSIKLSVPVRVEAKAGSDWGEMKPLGKS